MRSVDVSWGAGDLGQLHRVNCPWRVGAEHGRAALGDLQAEMARRQITAQRIAQEAGPQACLSNGHAPERRSAGAPMRLMCRLIASGVNGPTTSLRHLA
jgi:hypothetical protein